MTDRRRRLGAEIALVAIAAVWGLTFVMVQDAIEVLPTMAFLGYRFVPAALIQTLGLERTTASNAGFITGLFVVLTPLLGAIFLRDRLPPPTTPVDHLVAGRGADPHGDRRGGGRAPDPPASAAARGLTPEPASLRSKQRDSGASR